MIEGLTTPFMLLFWRDKYEVSPILLQFLTLSMSFSMIFAGTIMPALGEKLGRAELCILNETIVRNSKQ